jgi:hypothetical protein
VGRVLALAVLKFRLLAASNALPVLAWLGANTGRPPRRHRPQLLPLPVQPVVPLSGSRKPWSQSGSGAAGPIGDVFIVFGPANR